MHSPEIDALDKEIQLTKRVKILRDQVSKKYDLNVGNRKERRKHGAVLKKAIKDVQKTRRGNPYLGEALLEALAYSAPKPLV